MPQELIPSPKSRSKRLSNPIPIVTPTSRQARLDGACFHVLNLVTLFALTTWSDRERDYDCHISM